MLFSLGAAPVIVFGPIGIQRARRRTLGLPFGGSHSSAHPFRRAFQRRSFKYFPQRDRPVGFRMHDRPVHPQAASLEAVVKPGSHLWVILWHPAPSVSKLADYRESDRKGQSRSPPRATGQTTRVGYRDTVPAVTSRRISASLAFMRRSLTSPMRSSIFWPADSDWSAGSSNS